MFNKRIKKDSTYNDIVYDDNDNDAHDDINSIIRDSKMKAKSNRQYTGHTDDSIAVDESINIHNRINNDMNEYIGKRATGNNADTLDNRLYKYMNDSFNNKLTDIFDDKNAEQDQFNTDIQKLSKYELLSKQIKDEVKQKAYWSIGMLEVDIGIDRKINNIEATEQEKKNRLIHEYVKTAAKNILKNKNGSTKNTNINNTSSVIEKNPTEDIKNWIWRPKDNEKDIKVRQKKELENLMKAFERSGKVYAKKKLLDEMGITSNNKSSNKVKDDPSDEDSLPPQ